jgi:YVTN family beta-propeller protein
MQGGSPYDMDMNLNSNRIYVTLFENRIAVLDRTSFQLIENIIVGSNPSAIAENWKTKKLYVANIDTDTVSVIDTKRNIVTKDIGVGTDPKCIAIDREMNRVFVATLKGIYVIDGSSDQIITIIKRTINNEELGFSIPHSLAFNPTTGLLYLLTGLSGWGEGTIWVFDTKTNSLVQEAYGLFFTDNQIAVNPLTNKLYAQEAVSQTFWPTIKYIESTPNGIKYTYSLDFSGGALTEGITIFNQTTKMLSRITHIGYSRDVTPRTSIVVDSSQNKIFYSPQSTFGSGIFILDGENDTSLRGINGGFSDASINEKKSLLFGLAGNQILVYDTNSETLQTSIVLPSGNGGICTDQDTNIVYIINPDMGTVSVIEDSSTTSTPTAYFQYLISLSNNNQMLTCDGSLSYDPSGGNITSYNWDFGDGNQKTTIEPMVTHRYATPGRYKISLSVENQNGLINSFSNTAASRLAISSNFGKTTGTGLYDPGSQVEIKAMPPTAVEGERYLWDGWSGLGEESYTGSDNPALITLDEDVDEVASWRKQFYVDVITGHGQIQGGGWYDQDSTATISVTEQIPMDGLPGLLGGKIIFQEWRGDMNSTEPVIQLFMDGKKNVSAVWKEDFGEYYNTLGIASIILVAIAIIFVFRRHARPKLRAY